MYVCYRFVVVCNWSVEKGKVAWNLTELNEATFTKNPALPQISSQDKLLWRQVVRFSVFELCKTAGTKSWAGPHFRSPWQFWTTAATNKLIFYLVGWIIKHINIFHSIFIHSFDLSARWQRDGSKHRQNFPDLSQTKPHRTEPKINCNSLTVKRLKGAIQIISLRHIVVVCYM